MLIMQKSEITKQHHNSLLIIYILKNYFMKKITKLFLLLVAIVAWGNVANAQTSAYCSTPSGHLGDPNFAAAASHILLTITNIDANNISVKVEPNTDGAPIDFLQVNPSGAGAVVVGTDEGALLSEYKAIINYTTPPANVTLEILWSNPAWGGRWMVQGITVPFAATCTAGPADTEIPTSFTATAGAVTSNSVELLLNATDNSGSVNYAITYGTTTLNTTGSSATQKSYIVTGLTASTPYSFSITAKDAANNAAANNPIVVNATTSAAPALSTINFETVGQDWAWTLFENGDNAPALYSVVSNPGSNAVNSSTSCAKYIVNPTGQPWAGLWSDNLPDFTFTADNCIVKVMVYKSVISNFDVKFEGAGGLNFEKQVPNTVINQWEELTFDFTNRIGSTVTRLVIIPDFPGTRTAGSTNYFDNISFNSNTVPPVPTDPTVAAPTPTPALPSNKVISLFSNLYSNVNVDTWRTDWSNASYEAVQVAGNDTKKYTDLVFVGAETTSSVIDATAMTHLHLNVWTPDITTFKVKLVDFGANGVWNGGGDDVEYELTFAPTLSAWNTYNIPLSDFTGLTTRAHLAQYIFSGSPTGKVFIDNVYFYDGTNTALSSLSNKSVNIYPNPVNNQMNVSSENEISQVIVRNLVGQTVKTTLVNGLEKSIDLSDISSGNYFVTVKLANGENATKKFVKL